MPDLIDTPDLIDIAARVNSAAWERHARLRLADPIPAPEQPTRFYWTQFRGPGADPGPGIELFGDLAGARIVELGCGPGDNLAHLAAHHIARAIGVDLAAGQITRARARWGHLPNLSFLAQDARAFLAGTHSAFDICYSVFGAVEFCPPAQLLPLIAARLRTGGRLLFSARHPAAPPVPDLLLSDGTAAPLMRFEHSVPDWTALILASGLDVTAMREIRTGDQAPPCCLIIAASKP